jgi:subtilisin
MLRDREHHQFIDPTPPKMVLSMLSNEQVVDWGITSIGAPYAWRYTKGAGIKVAIVDTGVASHPDLVPGPRWAPGDWSHEPIQGHGSHCAGIVAAVDNGTGVVGVAPESLVYNAQVLGAEGGGTFDDIAAGIRWAVSQGVDIISMSLGTEMAPQGPGLQDAVNEAVAQGVVLVAAAGNNYRANCPDSMCWPAKCDGVIPVAAVDRNMAHAAFSSVGPDLVHGIAMPGVDIYSTWLNGGYATLSGTSMATPMLAGFIALMLAYHAGDGHKTPIAPRGSRQRVDDVIAHLNKYVRPLGDGQTFGIGVIDARLLGADGD